MSALPLTVGSRVTTARTLRTAPPTGGHPRLGALGPWRRGAAKGGATTHARTCRLSPCVPPPRSRRCHLSASPPSCNLAVASPRLAVISPSSRRRLAASRRVSPRLAVISPSPRRRLAVISPRLAASRRRLPTRSAAAPSTPANRAPPVTCLQRASHALAAQQPSRAVSIVSLPRLIVHYQQRASHTAAQQPSRIGLPQPAPASPRQPPPAPAPSSHAARR